ncbi:MAG: lipopolysaccharide biosynthesis protein [Rubrivivax sp.]|nr:lipopolysaccharide biosynthesis protein [Rubrivivax sp.]
MLIQHTLRYLPAQLLSPLAQLLSMVLWTHWLAPEQMGLFTLVTVTQEIAYLLCLSWYSVYALRYLPASDDADGMRRYLSTENAVVAASTVAGLAVAVVTALSLQGTQDLLLTSCAIGAYFVTRAASAHYAERARAQSAFAAYTWLQTAGPVGGLLLGWLALQTVQADAWTLLLAYGAAQAVGIALALPLMGMQWRAWRPDPGLLRAAASFGAPMIALGVLGWIGENYIRYLVQWREGAAALGLMIVGWALGRRCASVASMLVTTAAFPLASRLLNEGRRDAALVQLRVNAALLLAVLVPVTLGVEILGPALVALSVAEPYQQLTAELLGLSVFAGALRNLHMHVTDQLMVLERRFGMVARIDVMEIVACSAATMVGLSIAGIQGAVLGQALGSALTLLLSVHWARTRLGFVWPTTETLKVLVAASLMSLCLLGLKLPMNAQGLAIGVLLGSAIYSAAMAALFWPDLRRFVVSARA